MKNQLLFFLILLSSHVISCFAKASEPQKYSIVTSEWEHYTEKNGTGLYFELIDKTFGMDQMSYKLIPWKRAQIEFKKKKADLLIGESPNNKACLYPEWPIDADFFSTFYLKSKIKDPPQPNDYNTKYKVIWVRGYNIHESAPEITRFEEVDDMKQGIQMILKNRADVFIDYDEDLKDYIKSRKLNPEEHLVNPSHISGEYIYVCFKKDLTGKKLIQQFDQKMNELFKSGELKKIYLKYNREKNYQKVIQKKRAAL